MESVFLLQIVIKRVIATENNHNNNNLPHPRAEFSKIFISAKNNFAKINIFWINILISQQLGEVLYTSCIALESQCY